jgi:hypothetical protein
MAERTDPMTAVGTGESGTDLHAARRWERPEGLRLLWAGLLAGPLAWTLHLSGLYFVATFQCAASRVPLLAITVLCLAITVAGIWLAERTRAGMCDRRDDSETALETRSLFMARAGVWLGLGFLLVILVQALPAALIPPCHGVSAR